MVKSLKTLGPSESAKATITGDNMVNLDDPIIVAMANKIADLQEQIENLKDKVGQAGNLRQTSIEMGSTSKGGIGAVKVYFDPADKQGSADIIRNTYDIFAFMAVEDDMVRQAFEKDDAGYLKHRIDR